MISTLLFVGSMGHNAFPPLPSPQPAFPPLPNPSPSPAFPPLPSPGYENGQCLSGKYCYNGLYCEKNWSHGHHWTKCVRPVGGGVGEHCQYGMFCQPGLYCFTDTNTCWSAHGFGSAPATGQAPKPKLGAGDPYCYRMCAIKSQGGTYCADVGHVVDEQNAYPNALNCRNGQAVCTYLHGGPQVGWLCEGNPGVDLQLGSGSENELGSGSENELGDSAPQGLVKAGGTVSDPYCHPGCAMKYQGINYCAPYGYVVDDSNAYPNALNCPNGYAQCLYLAGGSELGWLCEGNPGSNNLIGG